MCRSADTSQNSVRRKWHNWATTCSAQRWIKDFWCKFRMHSFYDVIRLLTYVKNGGTETGFCLKRSHQIFWNNCMKTIVLLVKFIFYGSIGVSSMACLWFYSYCFYPDYITSLQQDSLLCSHVLILQFYSIMEKQNLDCYEIKLV